MANLSGSSIKVGPLLQVFSSWTTQCDPNSVTQTVFFSLQFAAVQFSTDYKTVFDFNQYTNGEAHSLLMKEPHMRGLTNTHKALKFVL